MKTLILCLCLFIHPLILTSQEKDESLFDDIWIHAGRTSAVVFWQLSDISKEAKSYVEYGETSEYGLRTETNTGDRRAQLHSIKELKIGTKYYVKLVILDSANNIFTCDTILTTNEYTAANEIKNNQSGAVISLDKPNTTYILTEDIQSNENAIDIIAEGITLELDGHTINFSTVSEEQYITGVLISAPNAKVFNGSIVQGDRGGNYSYAIGSRWKADGIEFAGLFLDVNRPNAYPVNLGGSAKNQIEIHHNSLYSSVTEIESRHYPGNDMLRVDGFEENADIKIHHNILTEGCHCGISLRAAAKSLEIFDNDIKHHQQFVNGYALYGSGLKGGKIYGNRISSIGRTIHLTAPDIEYYNNWSSTVRLQKQWHQNGIEING